MGTVPEGERRGWSTHPQRGTEPKTPSRKGTDKQQQAKTPQTSDLDLLPTGNASKVDPLTRGNQTVDEHVLAQEHRHHRATSGTLPEWPSMTQRLGFRTGRLLCIPFVLHR